MASLFFRGNIFATSSDIRTQINLYAINQLQKINTDKKYPFRITQDTRKPNRFLLESMTRFPHEDLVEYQLVCFVEIDEIQDDPGPVSEVRINVFGSITYFPIKIADYLVNDFLTSQVTYIRPLKKLAEDQSDPLTLIPDPPLLWPNIPDPKSDDTTSRKVSRVDKRIPLGIETNTTIPSIPRKSKRGPRRYSISEKLEAVKAWDAFDRDIHPVTLAEWLINRFDSVGGKLIVPTSTFYGWRRQLKARGLIQESS